MKLFTVKKGTKATIVNNADNILTPWAARKDLTFEREQVVIDHVQMANHTADLYKFCKDMEQLGWSHEVINFILNHPPVYVFQDKNYLFIVNASMVNLL